VEKIGTTTPAIRCKSLKTSDLNTQQAKRVFLGNASFGKVALLALALLTIAVNWAMSDVQPDQLVYEVPKLAEWPLFETNWLYAGLLLFTIAFPMGASFDARFSYFKKWRHLLPGLLLIGAAFIAWDVYFTKVGVWGFNDPYLTGTRWAGLPWEEWMFFICVPFSCVFILESVRYFSGRKTLEAKGRSITIVLTLIFFAIGLVFWGRIYTSTTFLLCGFFNLYLVFFEKNARLGHYYLAYLFCLIPFFLENGVLTGALTNQPVVVYNPAEFMGLRLVTIPAEDAAYGYLLIMCNFLAFDRFRSGFKK